MRIFDEMKLKMETEFAIIREKLVKKAEIDDLKKLDELKLSKEDAENLIIEGKKNTQKCDST
jgi:hypothetical protein